MRTAGLQLLAWIACLALHPLPKLWVLRTVAPWKDVPDTLRRKELWRGGAWKSLEEPGPGSSLGVGGSEAAGIAFLLSTKRTANLGWLPREGPSERAPWARRASQPRRGQRADAYAALDFLDFQERAWI